MIFFWKRKSIKYVSLPCLQLPSIYEYPAQSLAICSPTIPQFTQIISIYFYSHSISVHALHPCHIINVLNSDPVSLRSSVIAFKNFYKMTFTISIEIFPMNADFLGYLK